MSPPPIPGTHSATRRVFVGREPEISTLETRLAEAMEGRGSLVTLVGAPGIGKTRTVEELLTRAALPAEPARSQPGRPLNEVPCRLNAF